MFVGKGNLLRPNEAYEATVAKDLDGTAPALMGETLPKVLKFSPLRSPLMGYVHQPLKNLLDYFYEEEKCRSTPS